MKKTLLNLLLLMIFSTAVAQNVQDQHVTFQYIQLPKTPLKEVTSYSVVVNSEKNEKNNQDSLDSYNTKLVMLQANFDIWLEKKQNIDKNFLLELAKYEKAINGGGVGLQLPIKPAYPKQPIKEDILFPTLTQDIAPNTVESVVKLEGFSNAAGGATITVELMGFLNSSIKEVKTGEAATTKYEYTSTAKYPVHITISTPSNGIVFDKVIGNTLAQEKFKTKYDSKYDYQYWCIDNLETYWINRQKQILAQNLSEVYVSINNYCGFPLKTRSTEIFTVKKFKDHNYGDLVDAYTSVYSGYNAVKKDRNHASAKSKIMVGIAIWESTLGESNLADNKSRINKKVTALLYVNLAEAYMWVDDFDSAENYRIKAEQAGVLKYKSAAKRLESLIANAKNRYQSNN
jgi:hypothetical protein